MTGDRYDRQIRRDQAAWAQFWGDPAPRADNLDALPFADTADQDPAALPFGVDPDEYAAALARPCGTCKARPGQVCSGECPEAMR
jgi:hypothetical protein